LSRSSTTATPAAAPLLTSKVPVEHWNDVIGDPTFDDATPDRLLNNARRITLKGGSMTRLHDSTKEAGNFPADSRYTAKAELKHAPRAWLLPRSGVRRAE